MRILVCGGRDYNDYAMVQKTIESLIYPTPADDPWLPPSDTVIIHGGATGADRLAGRWAMLNDVKVSVYPADWKEHGRMAGPIRNQQMIDEGKPDIVLAFPGGRGTADMVRRTKAAGIKLIEVV